MVGLFKINIAGVLKTVQYDEANEAATGYQCFRAGCCPSFGN